MNIILPFSLSKNTIIEFLESEQVSLGVVDWWVDGDDRGSLVGPVRVGGLAVELDISKETVSMAGLLAGGISIHNGRTWHGSGRNESTRPRRGLGLHYIPSESKFTEAAIHSKLWKRYVLGHNRDVSSIELCQEDFPITWMPS